MDSDDEITPDCIQVLYDKMMEEKVDMVVGSYDDKLLNGTTIERIRYQNLLLKGKYKLAKYIFTQRGVFHMQLWNKLYNIQFLKRIIYVVLPHTAVKIIMYFLILLSKHFLVVLLIMLLCCI